MATWKENLRTPSFRGIRFNLWNAEREGGRNTVTHEFAGRELPYTEDSGRAPRRFEIEAFLSGFDYFRQRDRLIAALEQPGPGAFVHPYYGTLQVNVARFRVRETGSEGNVVRFSIEFVEAGSLNYPTVQNGKTGFLSDLTNAIQSASTAEFLDKYNIAKYPQQVVAAVQDKITELTGVLDAASVLINTNADSLADLASSIQDLKDDADDLIREPAKLATRMINAITGIANAVVEPREGLNAYKNLFDYGSSDPALNDLSIARTQTRINNKAFTDFVRANAISQAVLLANDISYESEEDAQTIKSDLFTEMDSLSEFVDDDATFESLENLRTFLSLNVPPEDQDLPNIIDYVPSATLPALIVCYEIFGDVDLNLDIVARNKIKNPNFTPGGQNLRILGRV